MNDISEECSGNMRLSDVSVRPEYRTLRDDVPRDFYVPLLSRACRYRRAVGFFSSTALLAILPGVCGLVRRGGRMEIVASPHLSEEDCEAIERGYQTRSKVIETALLRELDAFEADSPERRDRWNLLANLIAGGFLDLRIATTKDLSGAGMYHEKLGLIEDEAGNVVAFSGSMNESVTGLAENYEAFDVFCSWHAEDAARVQAKVEAFDAIWNDEEPSLDVRAFPEVEREILRRYQTETLDFDNYVAPEERPKDVLPPVPRGRLTKPENVTLYDYQQEAIERWLAADGCGIFDMATGTGKTYTGLGAAAALSEHREKLAVVIVCPFQHLVEQWADDVRSFSGEPIIAYSGSQQRDYKKRIRDGVFDFRLGVCPYLTILCTNATFASEAVQKELPKIADDVLLLVDEAHNLGAMRLRKTLEVPYRYRLALSATLERHHDAGGTEALLRYFGEKCIEYDLGRAIREGKLTPYDYHPVVVTLTEPEREAYAVLTKRIAKCIVKKRNGRTELNEMGKMLALKRARIVAGAEGKLTALRELMEAHRDDRYMLVYCGATRVGEGDEDIGADVRQIDAISRMLNFELGMETAQFTSREDAQERQWRLKEFSEGKLQALVAIKCLDEGVNVPAIRKAFLLASTTNPKEYIQRRGRVLRLSPGKDHADIYDFITLPRPLADVFAGPDEKAALEQGLVKRELVRMKDFIALARESFASWELFHDMMDAYHLYDFEDMEEECWEDL